MSARLSPSQMWLNPPRHDDPYEDIIIELHPASAAAAADALTEAAERAERDGDRESAYLLRHVADDIEAASAPSAAADSARLSREARTGADSGDRHSAGEYRVLTAWRLCIIDVLAPILLAVTFCCSCHCCVSL